MGLWLAAACGGSSDPPRVEVVDGHPLDGIVVRVEDRANRPVLFLFDARTGKVSAEGWSAPHWQVAPDGLHLFVVEQVDSGNSHAIATWMRFAWAADGAPTLVRERTFNAADPFTPPGPSRLAALGDRLYGDGRWHEATGARRLDCGGHVVSPDGRHHAATCDGAVTVFDDFEPIGRLDASLAAATFTEDGQWLVLDPGARAFHVPTRTLVDDLQRVATGRPPIALAPDWTPARWTEPARDVPAPGGRRVVTADGAYGSRMWCDFRYLPTGGTSVSQGAEQRFDAPAPITQFDPVAALATERDAVTTAADPRPAELNEAAYTRWTYLGPSDDGAGHWRLVDRYGPAEVLADVRPECVGFLESPQVSQALRRVDLDGAIHEHTLAAGGELPSFVGCPAAPPGDPSVGFGRVPAPLTELQPGTLACLAGVGFTPGLAQRDMNAAWGIRDDGTFAIRDGGRVATPDGKALVLFDNGEAFPEHAGRGLVCFTPLEPTATRRCVAAGSLGEPAGIGGWAAQDTRADPRAVVVEVVPRAAAPGGLVHVFGWGFGASGVVRVGAVAVDAADVIAWSDGQVVFRMTDGLPAGQRVTVDGPGGFDADTRVVRLRKTPRWEPDPLTLPSFPAPLREGLNVVDLGTLGTGAGPQVGLTFDANLGPVALLPGPTATTRYFALPGFERAVFERVVLTFDSQARTLLDIPASPGPDMETYPWNVLPALGPAVPSVMRILDGALTHVAGNALYRAPDSAVPGGPSWITVAMSGADLPGWLRNGASDGATWWTTNAAGLVATAGCVGVGPSCVAARGDVRPTAPDPSRPGNNEFPHTLAIDGQTWVYAGLQYVSGSQSDGFVRRSDDGGQTWSERTTFPATVLSLAETVTVGARPGMWGLARPYLGPGAPRLLHIARDGTVTLDAGPAPSAEPASVALNDPLHWEVLGALIIAHAPGVPDVMVLDTGAATLAWQRVTSAGLDGHTTALFVDHAGARLVAARDDAVILVSTAASPLDFVALAVQPPRTLLGTRARFVALGLHPDGRLIAVPDRIGDADTASGTPTLTAGLLGPVLP